MTHSYIIHKLCYHDQHYYNWLNIQSTINDDFSVRVFDCYIRKYQYDFFLGKAIPSTDLKTLMLTKEKWQCVIPM